MAHNIEQHEAFVPGLNALKNYVEACLDSEASETFSSKRYQEIIDSFGSVLAEHLTDEIKTLLALDACGDDIAALKKAYLVMDAKLREGDKVYLFSSPLTTVWNPFLT